MTAIDHLWSGAVAPKKRSDDRGAAVFLGGGVVRVAVVALDRAAGAARGAAAVPDHARVTGLTAGTGEGGRRLLIGSLPRFCLYGAFQKRGSRSPV